MCPIKGGDPGAMDVCPDQDAVNIACKNDVLVIDDEKSVYSITYEFELYCDDFPKKGYLGTAMMTIGVVSVFIMGVIANNNGRKKAIVFSQIITVLSMIGLVFIPTNY